MDTTAGQDAPRRFAEQATQIDNALLHEENVRLRAEVKGVREIQGFLEAEVERLHERIEGMRVKDFWWS